MRKVLVVLFLLVQPGLSTAGWFGPSTYEECVLAHIKDAQSDVAARVVARMCRNLFPLNPLDEIERSMRTPKPGDPLGILPPPQSAAPSHPEYPLDRIERETRALDQPTAGSDAMGAGPQSAAPSQEVPASPAPAQTAGVTLPPVTTSNGTDNVSPPPKDPLVVLAQFKNWEVDRKGNVFIAATASLIWPNMEGLGVIFNKEQQCKYRLGIFGTNEAHFPTTAKMFLNLEYRVDTNGVWRVYNAPVNITDTYVNFQSNVVSKLVLEMARGKQMTLRCQNIMGGSVFEDHFSLSGSGAAMRAAYQACIGGSI